MQTLSNGYKLPENTDTGDVVFPALEYDIQLLNSHTHNGSGTGGADLGSRTVNAVAASWVAAPVGGGLYRQSVTLPSGMNYDTCNIWFKLSTGEFVYPSIDRISASAFYVYTNDNSLQYACYFR